MLGLEDNPEIANGMDDEILFGHALDESWLCYGRLEAIVRGAAPATVHREAADGDLYKLLAEFELHGNTLRMLARWQPENPRFRQGLADWEHYENGLHELGLERVV